MAAYDDKTKSLNIPQFPNKTFFAKFPEKLTEVFFLPPWLEKLFFSQMSHQRKVPGAGCSCYMVVFCLFFSSNIGFFYST